MILLALQPYSTTFIQSRWSMTLHFMRRVVHPREALNGHHLMKRTSCWRNIREIHLVSLPARQHSHRHAYKKDFERPPVHVPHCINTVSKCGLTGRQDRIVRLWDLTLATEIGVYSACGYKVLTVRKALGEGEGSVFERFHRLRFSFAGVCGIDLGDGVRLCEGVNCPCRKCSLE